MNADQDRLESMLHKVRSLLDKAIAEGVTEEERELLNAKANELIARYGIDAAMLAERSPETDKVTDRMITVDAPYALDKLYLLAAIAKPLRVKLGIGRHPDGTQFAHLFGYGADLQRIEILFTSLLLQSAHGLQSARPSGRESVQAFRRTWLTGFAEAVSQRLEKADSDATATTAPATSGRSVELVLADRRSLAEQAFRATYPQTRRTTRRLRGSGHHAGQDAGMKANLGTGGRDLTRHTRRRQLG